jgi:hypothetical protein
MTTATATFGTGGTRTMFAALYGDLVPGHPPDQPGAFSSADAHRLFLPRSAAMDRPRHSFVHHRVTFSGF